MSRIRKTFSAVVRTTGERTITALVSTPGRDRDDDVIEPRGIELGPFTANPVIPWSHRYDQPPVGRATAIRATSEGLLMDIEFTPQDLYAYGAQIGQMYKHGYLNAFSIGFVPMEWAENEWGGRTYTRIELLEVSAVLVPANASALVVARSLGLDLGSEPEGLYLELADDELYLEVAGAELFDVDLAVLARAVGEAVDESLARRLTALTGRLD